MLTNAGAKIVYLTGRDIPRMHDGTVISLARNRFPMNASEAELIMKPDPKIDDLEFKKAQMARIAKMGEVIGVFENEPANLNAMADEMFGLVLAGKIKSEARQTFALKAVAEAHRVLESRGTTGATVLLP